MSFTAPKFTDEGKALQAKAQAGTALKFTKMQLGDGELGSQAIAAMTGLVNPLITVGISGVKAGNNYATVKSNFSNSGLTTGFYWREIGVFAADPEKPNDRNSDILYCYANAGSLAAWIPSAGSEIVEKIISIPCIIGDAENVSAEVASEIYATKEALKEHIDNKNNPHGVTAKQLGALTDESLTKEKILNKIDVLDIAHGGTGKATKKEAFANLAYLGFNPISSPDEDTTAKWCELGNGYAWFNTYDTNGSMINQPFAFMFVINYTRGKEQDNDVFQIGSEQKSGTVYYRTGNGDGWHMNWTPLLSTNGGTMSGPMYMNNQSIVFNKDANYDNGDWFSITAGGNDISFNIRHNGRGRIFNFLDNRAALESALTMWWHDDGQTHSSRFFGEHNTSLLATTIQNLLKGGNISVVKSIQHKSGIMKDSLATTDVTISAVNLSKSFISFRSSGDGTYAGLAPVGAFKDSTTVTLSRATAGEKSWSGYWAFDVIEFY